MTSTRIAVTAVAAAISVVLMAALGGCASSAGSSGVTLSSAKATTLSVETKMASFLPKSSIISTDQPTHSKILFPCLHKDNESYWPSTMTISVKPGLNTSDILDSIGTYWTNKSGWTVSDGTDGDGTPTMTVVSNSGYSFTAEFAQGPVFTVTSISACFPSAGLSGKSSY